MISPPATLPRFSWDNLQVDDDLGRVEGVVDESAVRAHAFAIGDNPERYLQGFGNTGSYVPPSLLVNDLLKMVLLGYDGSHGAYGGLHTKAVIDYAAPLAIGEHVTITGTHIAKYARKGRRYRTLLSQAVRKDGTVVARLLATETVLYDVTDRPDEGEIPKHWASQLPHVDGEIPTNAVNARTGRQVEPGMVLGPMSRNITLEQSVIFSGYPFSWAREQPVALRQSLHTNPDIAKKAGYPAPVAQGLMCAAHHTSLLLDHFGERVTRGAQLALSFVSPVLVGTILNSHAIADDERDVGGTRLSTLRLATKNAEGKLMAVGRARVPV